MQRLVAFFVMFLLSGSVSASSAAGNFIEIRLPHGVSIELPRNWIVLNGSQKITLDSAVESALDLAELEQTNSSLPFAANYYSGNGNTAAMVNIRFYPDLEVSQEDALAATSQDIVELDRVLQENISKGIQAIGGNVTSWRGTKRTTVNGLTVFITEYRRVSLISSGNFRVRLIRVFLSERSFTATISYIDAQEILLRPITDRIISSIAVAEVVKP